MTAATADFSGDAAVHGALNAYGGMFLRGSVILDGNDAEHDFFASQSASGENGSAIEWDGGEGGNADDDAVLDAGHGGAYQTFGGKGGLGTATHRAGDGGDEAHRGGNGNDNAGGGAGHGGTMAFGGGTGGAALASGAAGHGGLARLQGGAGGTGSAGAVGGVGADGILDGGQGGSDGGAGAGTPGDVQIGATNAGAVNIGRSGKKTHIVGTLVLDGLTAGNVTAGISNSGGVGFRMLIIPN